MHFTTEQGDAKTVFRLKDERLDSRNAGQLKAEFLILAQPDIDALIVDLSQVLHIDSAGISALLLAQRQMKLHSGEARLVGVRPDVLSMLRLTQLDKIFPIYATVEEALAAEVVLSDDDERTERELNLDEDDDLDLALGRKTSPSLGPLAPTVSEIRAGAIAAGGSLGAAALAKIMMTPYDDELTTSPLSMAFGEPALGDDEDFADDDDDLDDDDLEDDDFDDEDDDLEEDEVEEDDVKEVTEDVIEEDDFEDDDFDDEELEEDEEEDY